MLDKSRADEYVPTKDDDNLLEFQRHRRAKRAWGEEVRTTALRAICDATQSATPVTVHLPPDPDGNPTCTLTISIDGDDAEALAHATPATAHLDGPLMELVLRVSTRRTSQRTEVLAQLGPLLGPAPERDEIYAPNGDLVIVVMTSYAKLAQYRSFAEAPVTDLALVWDQFDPPTHAHYVQVTDRAVSSFQGVCARAICGVHFVVTGEGAELPICPRCEDTKPAAEQVLALRRALAQRRI